MKKANTLFILFVLSLVTSGCIDSPLLNHADAGDTPPRQEAQISGNCQLEFQKSDLCASLTWNKQPSESETGEFTLRFWKKSEGTEAGPYVSLPGTLAVKLWMPSMGHGSSPVKVSAEVDSQNQVIQGVFKVTQVYFSMPGDWEIWFQFKQGSQVLDQFKLPIQIQ